MITRIILSITLAILAIAITGTGFSIMLETQPERFWFLMNGFLTIGAVTSFTILFRAFMNSIFRS